MENKIALIDADFIPYYVCHNKKLEDNSIENKSLEECQQLAKEFIDNILISTNCNKYVIALTIGKCFRYRIFDQYKANRKPLNIPYLKEVKDFLIENYNTTDFKDELEADDIVIIAKKLYPDSIIISPDKDIIKCTPGVHYNPRVNKFVNTTPQEANYNFWTSMITGDTTDGVDFCPNQLNSVKL